MSIREEIAEDGDEVGLELQPPLDRLVEYVYLSSCSSLALTGWQVVPRGPPASHEAVQPANHQAVPAARTGGVPQQPRGLFEHVQRTSFL